MVCRAELRGLAKRNDDFARAGARIVSITADTSDAARSLADKLPFPVLPDPDLEVTRQYTAVHTQGGPRGTDVARPTTVVVGMDGRVRAVTMYDDIRLRPDPEDLLKTLKP